MDQVWANLNFFFLKILFTSFPIKIFKKKLFWLQRACNGTTLKSWLLVSYLGSAKKIPYPGFSEHLFFEKTIFGQKSCFNRSNTHGQRSNFQGTNKSLKIHFWTNLELCSDHNKKVFSKIFWFRIFIFAFKRVKL